MYSRVRIRLPTRHMPIQGFSQRESETLFDICTQRRILHVDADGTRYNNQELQVFDSRELRHVTHIDYVWISVVNCIRPMRPIDLENPAFVNDLEECVIVFSKFSTTAHVFINFN